jgi:cbb3-type cytochrome oxidase maturation protein
MSVIYLLISISIVVAIGFFIAFIRAVKTGQYDDDYTPSVRMLFDDELVKKASDEHIQITETLIFLNKLTNTIYGNATVLL